MAGEAGEPFISLSATEARELLDQLAQELLREETLGQDALARILGPRPATAEEKLE